MELPKDFMTKDSEDCVLKLNKTLYGLQQPPLEWLDDLKSHLEQCGFVPSKSGQCLFINKKTKIFCLVYVDDVVWV